MSKLLLAAKVIAVLFITISLFTSSKKDVKEKRRASEATIGTWYGVSLPAPTPYNKNENNYIGCAHFP